MKIKCVFALLIISILSLFAIAADSNKPQSQNPPAAVAQQAFPYIAQIIGFNVNVRSGPGMNYYSVGKLGAPAQVVVVDKMFTWCKIIPPLGCFSWISKEYVQIAPQQSGQGTVIGNAVRVWAGSPDYKPIHSTSLQVQLNRGDRVKLLGDEQDGYYKIAPPAGAYVWVNDQYTKFIRSAAGEANLPQASLISAAAAAGRQPNMPSVSAPVAVLPASTDPNAKPVVVQPVKIRDTAYEVKKLEEYRKIAERIESEKAKPLTEQDYNDIRTSLTALSADPNSGKAGNYSKYMLMYVNRLETAKLSSVGLEEQKARLEQARQKIAEELNTARSQAMGFSQYAVIGILSKSRVFESKLPQAQSRFLISDDFGNPVCYAVPAEQTSPDVLAGLNSFLGRRVGLVGKIEPDLSSRLAIVKFTAIREVEK